MALSSQELPLDVRRLIESPPVPFEELEPYKGKPGLYELDSRPEAGYEVVLLLSKLGEQMLVSTIVEKKGKMIAEIKTPSDMALDRLHHTFPNVDPEATQKVIPRAA